MNSTSFSPPGLAGQRDTSQQSRVGKALVWASQRPWLALPFVAIPALLPFFTIGLTASSDGMTHLMRVALLDSHVRTGMIYPRWVPELVTGLGYPVFNFYGPSAYYLAETFHLLGLTLVQAMIAAYAVLLVAAGFGMYVFARDIFGATRGWAALIAATAYMYAPYLLTNVYIRGAIAEVGAQALLPWILWSARRLLTSQTPALYVLALALTLGGLAVTHTITLILFPPFLAGYVLIVWWQNGRRMARLGWMVVGLVAAMGLSAFFWMPLVWERQYLSEYAYDISTKIFVPENVWTWRNFLDTTFVFDHTFAIPFQLGLVQLTLAMIGLLVARRRDPEWIYLIIAAVIACLGIGSWTLPIWLSNQLLLATQFPWRLLTVVTVAFSLFSGAIVLRLRREFHQAIGALALVLLIIVANRPDVGWMGSMDTRAGGVTLPQIARHESQTGQMGTGPTREFMPRWNQGNGYSPVPDDRTDGQAVLTVQNAGAYGLEASISSPTGGPLRFSSLYFPGWRAVLDDDTPLSPYPSTNLGLLTVDLPAGSHRLRVTYAGTALQHGATWITLATLALLTLLAWRCARPRWIAGIPLVLLLAGFAAQVVRPAMVAVHPSTQPLNTENLTLVGYRLDQSDQAILTIFPYWYVRQTPAPGTRIGWELRDASGQVVNSIASRPYFNSQEASNWPPGTVADDGYQLPLPPGLATGTYGLFAEVLPPDDGEVLSSTLVATIDLEATAPPQAAVSPATPLDMQFGNAIRLEGFDLLHNKEPMAASTPAKPGDTLTYTLYWRAETPPVKDYYGFVHLVDHEGNAVAKQDHLPGSFVRPPMVWDTASVQPDSYTFQVPQGIANGLLWPTVGLYDYDSLDYLPVQDAKGQPVGDVVRLSPVKIFAGNPTITPQHPVQAQFGEEIRLLGYDLALPETGLHPGTPLTLTLYYQGQAHSPQDLTQFVHLENPDLGMAAQTDSPPLNGGNPTSTWVPGEIVVDRLTLAVAEDAAPGVYALRVGLYNPVDGTRVRATDAIGNPLPDNAMPLADLRVEP